ncbi:MAG: hypothetical protein WHT28_12115 [Fimbriimonadales bacterium]|jgi:hypothetical protein
MLGRRIAGWFLAGIVVFILHEYNEIENFLYWFWIVIFFGSLLISGIWRIYLWRYSGLKRYNLKHMLIMAMGAGTISVGACYLFEDSPDVPQILSLASWIWIGVTYSLAGYALSDIFLSESEVAK